MQRAAIAKGPDLGREGGVRAVGFADVGVDLVPEGEDDEGPVGVVAEGGGDWWWWGVGGFA